jgi:hypothetical protein
MQVVLDVILDVILGHHMQKLFYIAQAGIGVPQELADDGRNSKQKNKKQVYQFLQAFVHGRHVPSVLCAKEGKKCATHEYAA